MPAPESHRSVASLRRRKLCLFRFRANTKAHPARCSSSPHKIFNFAGSPSNAQSYPVRTVIQLSRIVMPSLIYSFQGFLEVLFRVFVFLPLTYIQRLEVFTGVFQVFARNFFICPSSIYIFEAFLAGVFAY